MFKLFKRKKKTVAAAALDLFEAKPKHWYNEAEVTNYVTRYNNTTYFTSTVGRELRKMREAGQLIAKVKEGKRYKIYQLAEV